MLKWMYGINVAVFAAFWLCSPATAQTPLPEGWIPGDLEHYEVGIDRNVFAEGEAAAYIKSTTPSPERVGTIMQSFSAENYLWKRVRMAAFVRASNVRGWAGLWMRVDGQGKENYALSFDNMQERPISGTVDWKRYEIVLDVPPESKTITFGILLEGVGKVWVDEFTFEVVTKDVPVTRQSRPRLPTQPRNLGFEEEPTKRVKPPK
jgi:hypothetical protein